MAAYAPEGTIWARQFHAFDREVQAATGGKVQIKWYLGGIAGDEATALARVRKGQLDGEAGALFCEELAPSIRVGRVVGLFRNRDEWHHVMGRLRKDLDRELQKSGFVNLGIGTFGNILMFSRDPIRTIADLQRERFWVYDLDTVTQAMLRQMGANLAPLPVDDGLKAYDERRVDGFLVTAAIALAFQFSARTRYYSDLAVGILPGCIVIAQRAFDPLSLDEKAAIMDAAAHFQARFEELGREQDDALLGGLFQRQGLRETKADPVLREAFFEAAHAAREKLGAGLVSEELLQRVLTWLADFRADRRR
jgi:TRAP-type C4-dicarboxylate transport system substrate-binding protein